MSVMKFIDKFNEIIIKVITIIAAGSLSVTCIIMLLQVFLRRVFNSPIVWAEDLAVFIFIWITFLGAAILFQKKAMISVDSFVMLFSEKVRLIIELIVEESARMRVTLIAYCLMPDHVHLLVRPEGGENVVDFVRRVKSRATRVYWSEGGAGRLWQRGFYDHILREDEDLEHVVRYVLANPVRAGLVSELTEYPYSGSLLFDKTAL